LAVGLLVQMPLAGLEPDTISYGAAISACKEAALRRLAFRLLAQSSRCGLEPTSTSCSAAINTCVKAGDPDADAQRPG